MYSSRLSKLEEKRNFRKALALVLGSIAIIIMVLVLGIPALVKMAMFIEGLGSSGKTVTSNDSLAPSPPVLIAPYDATNSAKQEVWGMAEPGSVVYLYQNSNEAGNVTAAEDGSFRFSSVVLTGGNNDFFSQAIDQSGNKSRPSNLVKMLFVNKAPTLVIESPVDRQVFNGQQGLDIKGTTDPGVRISVNDRIIIVDGGGKFSGKYYLNNGENVLIFTATDRAGNYTRKEMAVTYNP